MQISGNYAIIIIFVLIALILLVGAYGESEPPAQQADEPEIKEYAPEAEPQEETESVYSQEDEPSNEFIPHYSLTNEERDLVERVVMGEAGGEDYIGMLLVTQCIINACIKDGIRPGEAILKYRYTKNRPTPSEEVQAAVSFVFDSGYIYEPEPIMYFYAPALCSSTWHETQSFVLEHGAHRFYKEAN